MSDKYCKETMGNYIYSWVLEYHGIDIATIVQANLMESAQRRQIAQITVWLQR